MDWPWSLLFPPIGGFPELWQSLAAGMLNCNCYATKFVIGSACVKFIRLSQFLFRENVACFFRLETS